MAVPADKTLKDLNGTWIMNKTLSDPTDPILQLQGIGWLIRQGIKLATIQLNTTQYPDPVTSASHIDIVQPGFGNIGGTTEKRVLDGEVREHTDHIFGAVKGYTRWTTLASLSDEDADEAFLKGGWCEGEGGADGCGGEEMVDSFVERVDGSWVARQVWGFREVDVGGGKRERRYARRTVVRKKGGKEVKRATLIYDYRPRVEGAA